MVSSRAPGLTNHSERKYIETMPATTEILLEQIEQQESAIKAAAESGHDTKSMREELAGLKARLAQARQALTENKQLLKD